MSLFLTFSPRFTSFQAQLLYVPDATVLEKEKGEGKRCLQLFFPAHKKWNSVKNALQRQSTKLLWLLPARSEQF